MDGETPEQLDIIAALTALLSRQQYTSGRGLLDARALWAGVVGPQRLAMAQNKSVILQGDRPAQITKNLGASDVYKFVGVSLPFDIVVPVAIIFGREEQLGLNAVGQISGGGFGATGFMQLVLPNEQLYAQIAPVVGAPAMQRIVVAEVMF